MVQRDTGTLKSFFETGDQPTGQNFSDLIDSFYNIEDTSVISTQHITAVSVVGTHGRFVNLAAGSLKQGCSDLISDLKALTGMSDGDFTLVKGGTEINDNGGGLYIYDADASATDNYDSVVAPDSGVGRWLRVNLPVHGKVLTPEIYGAVGASADDTDALVALASVANSSDVPVNVVINGTHKTTKTIEFTKPGTVISGGGKIIKGGAIAIGAETSTDNYSASSLVTLAGEGSRITGLTLDGAAVDTTATGYGRCMLAICADNCVVDGVKVRRATDGIFVAWSTDGFTSEWTGSEVKNTSIINCAVVSCIPHQEDQAARGSGIRSNGSGTRIHNNYVQMDDAYLSDLYALHGIKVEGQAERHGDESTINDYGASIEGNVVVGPFRHSIYVEGTPNSTVSNNVVFKPGREAVRLAGANITASGNVVHVGGNTSDSNEKCGVVVENCKNFSVTDNLVFPYYNDGSDSGYVGIQLSGSSGHGFISGNVISRNLSAVTQYAVGDATGTFTTAAAASYAIEDDTLEQFRGARSLSGTTLTVSQGTWVFEAGATITQGTSGWTATVSAWLDPTDATLDYGIYNAGSHNRIVGNVIEPGAVNDGIYCRYAINPVIDNNFVYGATNNSGIWVRNNKKDLYIRNNTVRDTTSSYGINIVGFDATAEAVIIKDNILQNNAVGINFGTYDDYDATTVVDGNLFIANTTTISNPREDEFLYGMNIGYAGATKFSGGISVQNSTEDGYVTLDRADDKDCSTAFELVAGATVKAVEWISRNVYLNTVGQQYTLTIDVDGSVTGTSGLNGRFVLPSETTGFNFENLGNLGVVGGSLWVNNSDGDRMVFCQYENTEKMQFVDVECSTLTFNNVVGSASFTIAGTLTGRIKGSL